MAILRRIDTPLIIAVDVVLAVLVAKSSYLWGLHDPEQFAIMFALGFGLAWLLRRAIAHDDERELIDALSARSRQSEPSQQERTG